MNATLAAVLGLTLAQAPAPDYFSLNTRKIVLPIEYTRDRKLIRQVQLFVSADRGATWTREGEVWPDQERFVYVAPKDGLYWFHIVIVDLKGNLDPANLTKEPPAMKALVDTTPPLVRFTNARRTGDRVVVEWVVDDQYPDDAKTKVYFRPAGSEGYWQEVTGGSRSGVEFPVTTAGPVVVKVAVQDLAGNKNEGLKELPAAGANTHTAASLSPGSAAAPPAAATRPGTGDLPPPMDLTPAGPGPVAPPGGPVAPTAPPGQPAIPQNPVAAAPPAVQPGPVVQPPAPQPTGPSPAAVFQGAPSPTAAWSGSPATPQPATDPRGPVTPAQSTSPGGNPNAVAVFSGSGQAGPGPSVEMSRVQVINKLQFEIGYQVEQQGPSGVSRVDLWVTRDDGQSWVKWSQHDGRETPIRVVLDARSNTRPEGLYGFRLVPVSGAGLSEREPTRGDAPDLRVIVDLTPPRIEWYDPVPDPHDPGVLVFQWRATDQNFGDNPITLEWAENRAGPWAPVAGGTDAVVRATGTDAATRRLPNTGRYAWRVPAGLPPRVYIKITARDAAGNVQEGVIEPVLIDLAKPRARIHGIVTGPALSRP